MKKLFLSSSFSDTAGIWRNINEDRCKGKTVTFIPTASTPEKVIFYVNSARKAFAKSGIIIDELDISTVPYEEIK